MEQMFYILVTLTSRSDSDFERSNVSFKENKPDGINPNSNDIDNYVRKNEGKILWFSADCFFILVQQISYYYTSPILDVLRTLIGEKNPNILNVGLCSAVPDQHSSRD